MNEASFNYRIRVSARSRNVSLRVTPEHGLEIVVPPGYDPVSVPSLIRRKERWIRAALERVESYRASFGLDTAWRLPPQIALPAMGLAWEVIARATHAARATVRETGAATLLISGAIHDESACRVALRRWLIRRAQAHLAPQLQALGHSIALRHGRVSVRCQRTRWGSCSRAGAISLNAKLLFLPPPLVDYVLIHELCHLVHMNHSKRFWARVARHCPDFRGRDKQLRGAWKHVPRWAV